MNIYGRFFFHTDFIKKLSKKEGYKRVKLFLKPAYFLVEYKGGSVGKTKYF